MRQTVAWRFLTRYLSFKNTPFLKQNEEQYNYVTHLWRTGKGAQLALFPNLNAADSCNDRVCECQ